MSRLHVDPNARHPLYSGAISLAEVHAGVQFITLDTYRGNVALTEVVSEWRAENVSITSANGFHQISVIRLRADGANGNVVDFHETGVHPPVEASELWNPRRLSVRADRRSVLDFYPWLVKEGFMRAASELEDTFFDFFADTMTYWDQLVRRSDA